MLHIAIIGALLACAFGAAVPQLKPRLPDHRIVGGELADISEFPHQLSFRIDGSHACGASVISSKWALTAAHCVAFSPDPELYSINAASSYRRFGVLYNVSRVITHPKYDDENLDFDYALVKIDGEFEFGPNLQPIKLANGDPIEGWNATVTGWGTTKSGGSLTDLLMKVSVPIVERYKCLIAYEGIGNITDNMVCAGYLEGGKDACQGDSGGPLVVGKILYGVVSWGLGCAEANYPGVYSNVATVRAWLREIAHV